MPYHACELQGVTLGGRTYKMSQFADDTQFLLRSYDMLGKMWGIIDHFEEATAMRANKEKFEGLRLGATKRTPVPANEHTAPIKFVSAGTYMKLLGIPFWEEFDVGIFWEQLYDKIKRLVAAWRDHARVSAFGRAMLAGAMVFSRPRYWVQSMDMPQEIADALESDVQALVWAKDVTFDVTEFGTNDLKYRRWMKKDAQYGDRKKDLGLGLLNWSNHCSALRIKWL